MKKRMKWAASLRFQMILLMSVLVCLQSVVLAAALLFTDVYTRLDAEAFRFFQNDSVERQESFNAQAGSIVKNLAGVTLTFSDHMLANAEQKNKQLGSLYMDDAFFHEFAMDGTEYLISLIDDNLITGAFLLLNGSNADKENPNAHSAIYIRNSALKDSGSGNQSLLMEVGPIEISKKYQIATGVNWDLDMVFDMERPEKYAFYFNPIQASEQYPKSEIERYGYWSPPFILLGDNQQVICYTMPLLDSSGTAYGVIGVEISLTLIKQSYLPNTNMPFNNSFYAVMPLNEKELDTGWIIPGGPTAQVYLRQTANLSLDTVQGTANLFSTTLPKLGAMYCSRNVLTLYSRNSPFFNERWALVGFVSKDVLHETSTGIRKTLTLTIWLTTILAFFAILLLAFISTRKIVGLSKYLGSFSSATEVHFNKTGLLEIDELTMALERLNKNVIYASKRMSKILEMTSLPLGGFELSADSEYVFLTEYIYILFGIDQAKSVSKEEWAQLYLRLTEYPESNYENVYRYAMSGESRLKWLRIMQTETETEVTGVILDVTKDIEERHRLLHELDYDALTRLYNRSAFKREVLRKLEEAPDKIGVLIFSDLDNLKYVNDTYGHDMGDRLIINAGEMFRSFEPYGGVVSRISGDEFAIYIHGYDSQEEARALIDDVYEKNSKYMLTTADGKQQKIRYSSGIAWYPKDSDDVQQLLKYSDYAMYEAKHNSKGSLFEFDIESYTKNIYVLENREAINKLLDEGLIRFAYQPIVDLKTGQIFGYEALMRSLYANFHSPYEILTVAAAQSKLGQLERLVFMKVFQEIKKYQDQLQNVKVFINSIPNQQLTGSEHFQLKQNYSEFFSQIVIEITEDEVIDTVKLQNKIELLHESDMQIAIDDFGTGYSNEIRIFSVQPHVVKIAMELIRDIDISLDKQKLVQNIVSFCKPKGIKTIAEGVETADELETVIKMEMDYVQGYFTGRPEFHLQEIKPDVQALILALNEKYHHTL